MNLGVGTYNEFAVATPLRASRNRNLADKANIFFFITVSLLLLVRTQRFPGWRVLLLVNLGCLLAIELLVRFAGRAQLWRFLHEWYPLAMPIVTFEEVSRLSFIFRSGWQDGYILDLEARLFSAPPTVWLGRHSSPGITELLEIGYFSYFVLLMIVAGAFYARSDRRAFREVMDATVLSYILCYVVFLLCPTEGPAYTLAALHGAALPGVGPFHWAVRLIQRHAGVHGNAFPSAHVAGGVVALIFALRYAPKLGITLTPLVILLCLGAVYDRYHYLSDVVAGVVFGALPALLILCCKLPGQERQT
jgi:membrane-associated phospholipid phosphatase